MFLTLVFLAIYFVVPIVLLCGGVTALFYPACRATGVALCLSAAAIGSALWFAAPPINEFATLIAMGNIVMSILAGAILATVSSFFLTKPKK